MGAERSPEPAEATVEVSCQIHPASQHLGILTPSMDQACSKHAGVYDMKMASHGSDSKAACCMPAAHSGIGMLLISERCAPESGMGSARKCQHASTICNPGLLARNLDAVCSGNDAKPCTQDVHFDGDGLRQPLAG